MVPDFREQISQIVEGIFSTMLRSEAEPVEAAYAEGSLETAVRIEGAWSGEVALSMSDSTALALAAAMLSTPEDRLSTSDAEDVAAELANMIGGNLKATLPSPSRLSVPSIRRRESQLGSDAVAGGVFRCGAGLFQVRVQEALPVG